MRLTNQLDEVLFGSGKVFAFPVAGIHGPVGMLRQGIEINAAVLMDTTSKMVMARVASKATCGRRPFWRKMSSWIWRRVEASLIMAKGSFCSRSRGTTR